MEWHINELSLTGQFSDPQDFRNALEPLLRLRNKEGLLKDRLYCCAQLISGAQVTATQDLRSAIRATKDPIFIRLVLSWLTKSGPFWDVEETYNTDNNCCEYKGIDVTEKSLGEIARRKIIGLNANAFSFQGSQINFNYSPVSIDYLTNDEPIRCINIDNYWDTTTISVILQSLKEYNSWSDVDSEIRNRFIHLNISKQAMSQLLKIPFSSGVMNRIFTLLDVLNRIVQETDNNGQLSTIGQELKEKHFVGDKAWFTDESSTNISKFKDKLTFQDPDNPSASILCTWHGKIKTPQIRIHFEWPLPVGQQYLKVVYIGPKITKA